MSADFVAWAVLAAFTVTLSVLWIRETQLRRP